VKKPRYGAHKAAITSDGIQAGVERRFDATKPMTPDDIAMLKRMLDGLTPRARMERLQTRLAGLAQVTTPEIKLRVDAIRAILEQVPTRGASRADLDMLDKAEAHWGSIMVLRDVMPLARAGHNVKEGRARGGKKTAEERRRVAEQRNQGLKRAALNIQATNPRLSNTDLARMLHDRGHGGIKAIEKKLPTLLSRKKVSRDT
jgi:hypothetical protein